MAKALKKVEESVVREGRVFTRGCKKGGSARLP
jgi:hypothetical protein